MEGIFLYRPIQVKCIASEVTNCDLGLETSMAPTLNIEDGNFSLMVNTGNLTANSAYFMETETSISAKRWSFQRI